MTLEDDLKNTLKLSLYEAKLYTALLQGEMGAKEASSTSGVPLPRVYDSLKTLEVKGFVERTDEGFRATSPEVALEGRMDQFRREFEEETKGREVQLEGLLEKLGRLHRAGGSGNEVLMLHGINSIGNKFLDIIGQASVIYLAMNRAIEVKDIFLTLLENADNLNVKVRILVPERIEISKDDRVRAERLGMEMRHYKNPIFDMMVADGRDVLIGVPDPMSDEVHHSIGIWVRNPSFAGPVQESLKKLWTDSL